MSLFRRKPKLGDAKAMGLTMSKLSLPSLIKKSPKLDINRPAKNRAAATLASRPVYVVVMTPQKVVKFELLPNGVREAERLPDMGATIYLFDGNTDPKDKRIILSKPMREKAARNTAYEVMGEKSRVIRFARDPMVIYARSMLSLEEFAGNRIIPGQMLIDHMLGTKTQRPTVFPIVFNDADGKVVNLIQFVVTPGGKEHEQTLISGMQVTARPDEELYTYTANYAKKNKITLEEGQEIPGASNAEMFSLASTLQYYPEENDLLGFPISQIYKYGAISSAVLLGFSVVGNIAMEIEAGYLAVSSKKATSDKDEVSAKLTHYLTQNIRPFAKAVSLDVPGTILSAQSIWHPNSVTKVDCTTQKCGIDLIGRFERVGMDARSGGAQISKDIVDESVIQDVLLQKAPAGFLKKSVSISGDSNVITVSFEQQKPSLPVFELLPH